MAKTSTSFTSGTAPKGNKGKKHKRTLVKESVGIDNWDQLAEWVKTKGIKKAVSELEKLKGKDYFYAYEALLEYVKPKLSRTTLVGDKDNPVEHKVVHVHSSVPIATSEDEILANVPGK